MSFFKKLVSFGRGKPTLEQVQAGHYPFLVTGCARAGTHFLTKFLQLNGMAMGHEATDTQGSVTWLLAAPEMRRERGVTFDKTAHLIRNPAQALQSFHTMTEGSWQRIYRYMPQCRHDDIVVASARYWLHWNNLSQQEASLSVRLEDFEEKTAETIQKLSGFFGRDLDASLIATARQSGDSRQKREDYGAHVTLEHVRDKDPATYAELKSFATSFGYATP